MRSGRRRLDEWGLLVELGERAGAGVYGEEVSKGTVIYHETEVEADSFRIWYPDQLDCKDGRKDPYDRHKKANCSFSFKRDRRGCVRSGQIRLCRK